MIRRADSAPRRPAPRRLSLGPWLRLLGLALAARLAAWALTRGSAVLAPDSRLGEIASNLAGGFGFSLDLASRGGGPERVTTAALPPLPPALLAATTTFVGDRPWLLPVVACCVGAIAALGAARLATTLFGPTVGRTAGACTALSPLLLGGAGLLEESLAGCALVLALGTSAEWLRTPRRGRALGAGLAWGACALCATWSIALVPLTLAWAWRPLGLELPSRARLGQAGLLVLGVFAMLTPWAARNAIELHAASPITTSSGIALLASANPETWSDPVRRGARLDVLRESPYAERLAAWPEPARDRHAGAEAFAFLARRRPADWGRTLVARLRRVCGLELVPDDPLRAPARPRPWATAPLAIAEGALVMLALWGIVRSLAGPRRWFQALPVLALATWTAIAALVSGSSRLRLEAEPMLALLAAVGLHHARRAVRQRGRGLRLVRTNAAERSEP